MQRVLIAGASGALGSAVTRLLQQRGDWVRVLSRSPERAAALGADESVVADATRLGDLTTVCNGVEVVFSCMGQSVNADMRNRGPGYHAVDYVGNHALLAAAQRAGVRRVVYVSVFGAERYPAVAYFQAHAAVAAEIRASGLSYAIIQPTGFFSAYRAFFDMARAGRAVVFGSGQARTNPIDDADLAAVCAEAIAASASGDIPAGGPAIYTRQEVVGLAYAALGRPVRLLRAPAWAPGVVGALAQPVAPRVGELMRFLGVVSAEDFIAPARGTRRLEAYYAELARQADPRTA